MKKPVALFLCCLPVSAAFATLMLPYSKEELVEFSDQIVIAEVEGTNAHYDDHKKIVTDYRFKVLERMKGVSVEQVTVRCLGGAVGDVGMKIEGECGFDVGDKAALFLRGLHEDERTYYRPIGMTQGTLLIKDVVLRNQTIPTVQPSTASTVARGSDGQLRAVPAAFSTAMPVAQFRDEVMQRIHQAGAK